MINALYIIFSIVVACVIMLPVMYGSMINGDWL